jgi:hypothetical protein
VKVIQEERAVALQWRACAADLLPGGDEYGTAYQVQWRDTREQAVEDLQAIKRDPIPWHHVWIERRTVPAREPFEQPTEAAA